MNGSLAGSNVTVDGGVLGGAGILGDVGIHPGGTVAPGHGSIGALTAANFGQAPGSTYQVELASNGTGDRINVIGVTELVDAPALQIIRADGGPYVLGTRYTVLTSGGGVTGIYTLTGDTQITAFLGFSAAYDPNNVYVDVAQIRSFSAAAQTANQLGTASGLGTLPATGALSAAILNLPNDAAAQQAFDQLSGEVHASVRSVLLSDSQFVRDAALARLRGTSGNSAPAVAEACEASTSCSVLDEMTVWARGFGSWGRWNGDGNASTVRRNTGGILVGADVQVMQRGRAGLLAGYSNSSIQAANGTRRPPSTTFTSAPMAGRNGVISRCASASPTRGIRCPLCVPSLSRASRIRSRDATPEERHRPLASLGMVCRQAAQRSSPLPTSPMSD